jgi:uncharacterized surface protein with fasciclin (FAS1) repeats
MKHARFLAALLSVPFISACGGSDDAVTVDSTQPGASITIDRVAELQGFNALLAAAGKADLGPALADTNARLTVFAPTDTAFNNLATNLGFENATAMVNALPASTLQSILSYHVLPTSKPASELIAAGPSGQPSLYSFEGQPAALQLDTQGGVTITDGALTRANVTTADVAASNGVIHVIDKVLVPPGVLNIVQMAQVNPAFSSLLNALSSAGLQEVLAGAGPFTVFAPTNVAFDAAPAGLSVEQLSIVLTYHALDTQVLASQIPFGAQVNTLAGQPIVIDAGTPPTIMDTTATRASINATDVRASNGVIHVIDKVLIPAL